MSRCKDLKSGCLEAVAWLPNTSPPKGPEVGFQLLLQIAQRSRTMCWASPDPLCSQGAQKPSCLPWAGCFGAHRVPRACCLGCWQGHGSKSLPQGSRLCSSPRHFRALQSLLMLGIAGPVKRKGKKSFLSPAHHTGRDRCPARRQPFIS